MAFIFTNANNEIDAGTLDILNGIFDIYLVTAAPSITNTEVSNLILVSGSSAISLVNNFTSTIWNFQSLIIPTYTYNIAPIGFVISKRTGLLSSSSDKLIYYSEFNNSIGQNITYSTGLYRINITFTSAGIINFNSTNEYFSGVYINTETIPKGLIYLLGTNNNTVTFTNPSTEKFNGRYLDSTGTGITGVGTTDRISTNSSGTGVRRIAWQFPNRTIQVGSFGWLSNLASANPCYLYGSNNLPTFTDVDISNTTYWTLLATNTNITGSNTWNFLNTTNKTYWKYLKWECLTDSFLAHEIEFYNSAILSTSTNLV